MSSLRQMNDLLVRRATALCVRHRPGARQLQLWVLLSVSMGLIFNLDAGYTHLPKGEFVSVIGAFVPPHLFDNITLFEVCRWGFLLSASAWLLRIGAPLTCWLTVGFYTLAVSFYWENLPWFRHKYVLPNWLLLAYAMWYQIEASRIRLSQRAGTFWQTALAPHWVTFLCLLMIGGFYTLSGVAKLAACGTAWGDGVSLQIWMLDLDRGATPFAEHIIGHPLTARVLQSGVLILELFAVLIAFSKTYRFIILAGLLALHAGVMLTFEIDFLSNIILLLTFVPPWEQVCVPAHWNVRVPSLSRLVQY